MSRVEGARGQRGVSRGPVCSEWSVHRTAAYAAHLRNALTRTANAASFRVTERRWHRGRRPRSLWLRQPFVPRPRPRAHRRLRANLARPPWLENGPVQPSPRCPRFSARGHGRGAETGRSTQPEVLSVRPQGKSPLRPASDCGQLRLGTLTRLHTPSTGLGKAPKIFKLRNEDVARKMCKASKKRVHEVQTERTPPPGPQGAALGHTGMVPRHL